MRTHKIGTRDVSRARVMLSRQRALDHLLTAVVAPITTTARGLPSEVAVGVAEGLKQPCVVNLDHLYTVAQADLKKFVGTLDARKMDAVCSALAVALGCA